MIRIDRSMAYCFFFCTVWLFVHLYMCPSVFNLNLCLNFWTARDIDVKFDMQTPLMMPFLNETKHHNDLVTLNVAFFFFTKNSFFWLCCRRKRSIFFLNSSVLFQIANMKELGLQPLCNKLFPFYLRQIQFKYSWPSFMALVNMI